MNIFVLFRVCQYLLLSHVSSFSLRNLGEVSSRERKINFMSSMSTISNLNNNEANGYHQSPKFFIVVGNLQSGNNIGDICRNALAFNASEVVFVGRRKLPQMRQTDRGSKQRLIFSHFNTIKDASDYLKNEHHCSILGVEIIPSAIPVTDCPFYQNTAFMFGNEGGGLSARQRDECDGFIYIPQFAPGGMASINVACASAIVMQTFAVWAKYPETLRLGEKFL